MSDCKDTRYKRQEANKLQETNSKQNKFKTKKLWKMEIKYMIQKKEH